MGALPRPDVPPGARRELVDALHDLHHQAGWPSLRTLAREAGCSHTTVSTVFSAPKLPAWGTLELIVEAMNGDPDHFHQLWLTASQPPEPETAPPARIAGRKSELTAVRRHLASGGGLLLVTGEAGIGKTKLIQTAADTTEVYVGMGRCLPLTSAVALMPIVDILRAFHESERRPMLQGALSAAPAYVRDELARLLPELRRDDTRPAATDEFARQSLFAAVARVLSELHRMEPVGIVVDDLHWADPTTLDLLEHLVASLHSPVPVVGTWRLDDPTVPTARSDWMVRMKRLPHARDIELPPLTLQETVEQVGLMTNNGSDIERAHRIHARSNGNPLFTEHLAGQADEDGPLPRLLTEVLDRSLDGLGPAGSLATTLGVADRSLSESMLSRVTALDHQELAAGLHQLADRHLVAFDDAGVRLRHPLLAEAARRRLVPHEAVEEHRNLATALASQPQVDAGEVAEHWRHAGVDREELSWRVIAARQAHQRAAPGEESAQWLRALELWPVDGADFDPIAARLATFDALEILGQYDEAREVIDLALAQRDELDDLTVAELLRRAALTERLNPAGGEAGLALLDQAIELLAGHDVVECLVHALDLRAFALFDLGRYDEATVCLDRALEACVALDDDDLYFGISATSAWRLSHLGDIDGALARVRDAYARLPRPTEPRREAYMAMMHTDALIEHHRPAEEVIQAAQRAIEICEERGIEFHLLAVVRTNVVQALLQTGRTRDAASALRDIPASDGVYWSVQWSAAEIDIAEGRLDQALEQLGALRLGSSLGMQLERARLVALAELWNGRPDRAWAELAQAIRDDLKSPSLGDANLSMMTLARAGADLAHAESGNDRASTLAAALVDLRQGAAIDPLGPAPAPISRPAATATWDAELARIADRDTVEMWLNAADAWDTLHSPHDAGYCRWRAAQAARRNDQGTIAHRLLRRAARDAREHTPLLTAIRTTTERG